MAVHVSRGSKNKTVVTSRDGRVVKVVSGQKVVVTGPRSHALPAAKVASAVELFGTKTDLAGYLGVSKTQPGRWIKGAEIPTPSTARLVTDLDYVWARITTAMGEDAAHVWLRSANPFLRGATPLDWLKKHGPSDVIGAFDAVEAGSYP